MMIVTMMMMVVVEINRAVTVMKIIAQLNDTMVYCY
jgi:hypothetical protein